MQTFCPDAPAIVAAVRHDLAAFARQELPHREALGYPPFASMVRMVIRGGSREASRALADEIGRRLRARLDDAAARGAETESGAVAAVRILGPAPAPMARLRGTHRYQIQLQSADGALLRSLVREATSGLKLPEGVGCVADVDPIDMM